MIVWKKLKQESVNLLLMFLLITFITNHSYTLHIESLITAWVIILTFTLFIGYHCYQLINKKDNIQFKTIKSIIDSKINIGFLLSLINAFLMFYAGLWISCIAFFNHAIILGNITFILYNTIKHLLNI